MFFKRKYRTDIAGTPEEDQQVVRGGLRIFIVLILVVGVLLAAGGAILYQIERSEYLSGLETGEANSLALQRAAITRALDRIAADVLFLASQNELILHLDTGNEAAVRDMEREYMHLARSRRVYGQIRFLDTRGQERVRVECRHGRTEAVPGNRLQDKSGRYYFKECIRLGRGDIFLSPMDLNVEHGRIEQPVRPVLRIGTPVFDSAGRKRGIVLINYDAKPLLERIRKTGITARGATMLLNCRGYWLLGPDADKEWGFMYPGKTDTSFAKTYPEEWKRMVSEEHGQFRTANGLFSFTLEDPAAVLREFSDMVMASTVPAPENDRPSPYFWTLASRVAPETLDRYTGGLLFKLLVGGGVLFALMAFGAWHLALALARRQQYEEQLVEAAMYDALTGLPNRKLFFDRLNESMNLSARYERRLALLYMDLDGFKEVNDTLGHEAGDELLKRVSSLLTGSVRRSDTVARLGGDEFIVMLNEVTNVGDAVLVGEKLVSALRAPIALRKGSATIGASVGVSVFPEHGDSAEILIQKADQAMYVSKRKGKNTCTMADSSRCADA